MPFYPIPENKMQIIFNGLDHNRQNESKIYLDIDVEKSVLFKLSDFANNLESKAREKIEKDCAASAQKISEAVKAGKLSEAQAEKKYARLEAKKNKTREEIIKSQEFGANVIFGQNLIVATTECEKELPYEPEEFFGPDINKERQYWLTYPISMPLADSSDKSFYFSKPEEIQKIEEELGKVNDLINETFKPKGEERSTTFIEFKGKERKCNSQTRRVLRRYWQELHKKQMKLIRSIPQLEKVFKFCETNQLGYAHDDITTGQKNGSFAQDKIRKIVQERQRKTGLPVSYTKPAYTSQTCPECGKRDKKNRDGNKFKCVECGYENVSHVVGAINICRFAQEQFTENANKEKEVRVPH